MDGFRTCYSLAERSGRGFPEEEGQKVRGGLKVTVFSYTLILESTPFFSSAAHPQVHSEPQSE